MTHDELIALCARLRDVAPAVGEPAVDRGEVSVDCPPEALLDAVSWLKQNGPFEHLSDYSAIDWLEQEPPERRYCISVQLASIGHPAMLRLRVWIPETNPRCPTLIPVWQGAAAHEREMFDFFGIVFDGHPNLARIFMPEGWEGHPQRKDYPLGGIDVRYEHGEAITPPDGRSIRPTTTTGYPGRTA